jgi:hypothetical protein
MPYRDIRNDENASPSPNPSHQGRGAASSSPLVEPVLSLPKEEVRWGEIQAVTFDAV